MKLIVTIEMRDDGNFLNEQYWRDRTQAFIEEAIEDSSATNHEPVQWTVEKSEWS